MTQSEQLFCHLIKLIHAPIHVYDSMDNLVAIFVDNGEQQDVLKCDSAFLQILLKKKNCDYPVLHLEAGVIIYGIIANMENTYVVGPCCIVKETKIFARHLIKEHSLNPALFYGLSFVAFEDFTEIVLMIYESVTGKSMSASEVFLKNFSGEESDLDIQKKIHQVFYDNQEQGVVHNPYAQEKREQQSIRTGDLEALEECFREAYIGRVGTLSHNSLRNRKNLSIVLITLASRSAMEGGVLPEIAYSMADAYTQRIDEMTNEAEVLMLARQVEIDFCRLVRDTVKSVGQNPLVSKCKELVLKYLRTKISVKELAEELEISPNYLSQLFSKEEGISLKDYITREKVRAASKQLIYTDDTYETIAYSYAFISQSHFGSAFKKWIGMTPGQYRKRHEIELK